MTFYHFINCMFLTFAPVVMLYKFSLLSEYSSLWRCGVGIFAYVVTQTCKLLIMAIAMTQTMVWDHIIDCFGLYWFMIKQQKASIAQVKILSIAVGWSFGESLLTRVVDFYINARSLQFDWKHLITAAEANLTLLQTVCVCSLLWQWSRGDNKLALAVLVLFQLALIFISPVLLWRVGATLALGALTLVITS